MQILILGMGWGWGTRDPALLKVTQTMQVWLVPGPHFEWQGVRGLNSLPFHSPSIEIPQCAKHSTGAWGECKEKGMVEEGLTFDPTLRANAELSSQPELQFPKPCLSDPWPSS